MRPTPTLPRYGDGALSDLGPSLLAALGAPGAADRLGLGPARAAVLLLVDGLGARLLADHAAEAPYLAASAASGRTLTAGFPSTTPVSIASLGTGLPPGEHGVVGFSVDTPAGVLNAVRWQVAGADARETVVPERFQPAPTVFEQVPSAVVAPGYQDRSGLTRAALRGAAFRRAFAVGDLVAVAASAAADGPGLTYAYHGDLDLLGHIYGPGSPQWRAQLRVVDRLVEALAEALPSGALLAVTGDHGMVPVRPEAKVDADRDPELSAGVRSLAGEPRARHVHAVPGAADDVLAAWRERLGDRMWVVPGEQAVADGWFGPTVTAAARARVGDVVAAAHAEVAVVRGEAEPLESGLLGYHGSLTPEELEVPLLLVRRP